MRGYFTTPISEHLEETPEGNLIARDCVIGRTGWQTYKIGDLPEDAATRMGLDTSNPNSDVELYRPAEEVFAPDTLRSAEGKAVTDNHPPGFVEPANFTEFARGHMQHVRKGGDALESGDWPMVADVHVTAEPLLSKVRNKLVRELSLGYDYGIRKVGDRIEQCDIVINHLAVVPKGRAGPEARIQDSAAGTPAAATITEPPAPQPIQKREKRPVADAKKHLIGRLLQAFAKDAEPEDIGEAAKLLHEEPPAQTGEDRSHDHRTKMHDALDALMDRKKLGDNAALEEYFKEEAEEPEHQDAVLDEHELEESLGAADGEMCPECEKPMADCSCAMDEEDPDEGAEVPGEGEVEPSGEEEIVANDRRVRAADTVKGARAVLIALKPVLARSNDASVKRAFNAALASVTRTSRATTGDGYARVAAGARTVRPEAGRDTRPARARAADGGNGADAARLKTLQDAYNEANKKGTI